MITTLPPILFALTRKDFRYELRHEIADSDGGTLTERVMNVSDAIFTESIRPMAGGIALIGLVEGTWNFCTGHFKKAIECISASILNTIIVLNPGVANIGQ